jgi:hypothetical protein
MSDYNDILAAEQAMTRAIRDMESKLHAASVARQVVELAGERRKMALSGLVVEHLNNDCSAAESEHRARADERYLAALRKIATETASAERVIGQYDLARHQYEAARSILAVRRAQIGLQ